MPIRFEQSLNSYSKIPGNPIAYWLSKTIINSFNYKKIGDESYAKAGVVSGNDKFFVREWFEVVFCEINLSKNKEGEPYSKYHIFSKGGDFRRYYGNYEHIIALNNLYKEELVNVSVRRGDKDSYFKKCISWSIIGSSSAKSFREIENSVCGTASPSIYVYDESDYYYILALLNSKYSEVIINSVNPTLNLQSSDVGSIPVIIDEGKKEIIDELSKNNVLNCKEEWDSFETSWDFKKHPLI